MGGTATDGTPYGAGLAALAARCATAGGGWSSARPATAVWRPISLRNSTPESSVPTA